MDASKKTHSFSLFNLAKKLSPLPNSEKAAIVAMADHIRRPEGYCSASLETLANEIGASVRGIRYGIHGRSKKDGTKYNPGLLERGLIFMDLGCSTGKGGLSKATVYRANLEGWLKYLPEEARNEVEGIIGNPAQRRHKGGTTEEETRHNLECDLSVNPLDMFIPGTNPATVPPKPLIRKENQEIETSTAIGEDGLIRFQRILYGYLGSDWPSQAGKQDRPAIQSLDTQFGPETNDLAFARFIQVDANTLLHGEPRTHLIGYYAHESGAAIPLCEQLKPWGDAGFQSIKTVIGLETFVELPEVTALSPIEAAEIDALGDSVTDRYLEFYERNEKGTLRDFAFEIAETKNEEKKYDEALA